MTKWLIQSDTGKPKGPASTRTLAEALHTGVIPGDRMVTAAEGPARWLRLDAVPEIQDALAVLQAEDVPTVTVNPHEDPVISSLIARSARDAGTGGSVTPAPLPTVPERAVLDMPEAPHFRLNDYDDGEGTQVLRRDAATLAPPAAPPPVVAPATEVKPPLAPTPVTPTDSVAQPEPTPEPAGALLAAPVAALTTGVDPDKTRAPRRNLVVVLAVFVLLGLVVVAAYAVPLR